MKRVETVYRRVPRRGLLRSKADPAYQTFDNLSQVLHGQKERATSVTISADGWHSLGAPNRMTVVIINPEAP